MIINIFDKLLFAAVVILTFQVSIISDHYLQYIHGYYQATKVQVDGYKANAAKHHFDDVNDMINELLTNTSSIVRTDAQQKQQTLAEFDELTQAIKTLKTGNLFSKAWFIIHPKRKATLNKVLENFQPSIPIKIDDVIYSIIFALVLSTIIMLPIRFIGKKLSGQNKKASAIVH